MRIFRFLAPLLCLLLGGQVGPFPFNPMFFTGVAGCVPALTNIGTSATNTITGVTVPSGSLIVVVAWESGSATSGTLADGTNTYTKAVTQASSLADAELTIFFVANSASLSGATITYTVGTGGDGTNMTAFYSSNIATTSAQDAAVTASTTYNNSTPSLTSGTPAQSGELFVASLGAFPGGGATLTFTQDTTHGWAVPPNSSLSSGVGVAGGSQVNSGTGTKIFAPTFTNATDGAIAIVGFKHC